MPQKRVRPHVNPLAIIHDVSFEGFGNDHPILVDVGACKGEFAFALAQQFPEKNIVVFEIRRPLVEKLRQTFKDMPNVAVFDGDAGRNFKSILKPCLAQGAKVEQIFINFPDPWFKEKHKKRRFINTSFLASCIEWLNDDVEWIFQTDQQPLFEETLEVVEASPWNHIEQLEKSPHGIQTDWEMAKEREGSPIWRMRFWAATK